MENTRPAVSRVTPLTREEQAMEDKALGHLRDLLALVPERHHGSAVLALDLALEAAHRANEHKTVCEFTTIAALYAYHAKRQLADTPTRDTPTISTTRLFAAQAAHDRK
jgi:hypothetical protein